jgi:hypothetical protein
MTMTNETTQDNGKAGSILLELTKLISLPILLGVIVLIYELNVEPERSLYNAVMRIVGTGEATHIRTTANDQAKMEQLMQLAVAEVERSNNAYAMYYQAMSQVIPYVYTMEDKLLTTQLETLKDSYGVTKFTANMGELSSAIGMLIGDPILASGDRYARVQREKMAREIKEIAQSQRSSIPQDLIRDLPKPSDLNMRTLEFKRLAEEIINDQ